MSKQHAEAPVIEVITILPPSGAEFLDDGITVTEADIEEITLTTPPWLEGDLNRIH